MDIKEMIDEYIDFLKQNITYRQIEKGYEITTPFLDNKNDRVQIYVDDINGEDILLSDDGATISNLLDSGLKLTSARKRLLANVAMSYGVAVEKNNLQIKTTIKDFAVKKHALLQAIIKIDDLSFTTQSRVSAMFAEDVADYFMERNIYNVPNISITGKSGFIHKYDFVLAESKYFKERFCEAINKPTKTNVTNLIFSWQDTFPQRQRSGRDGSLYAFLNDDNPYSDKLEDAFREYGILPIRKSRMSDEDVVDLFVPKIA